MATYLSTCTLPDGRTLRAVQHGSYDHSCNAHDMDDDLVITDLATGEELTVEEMNAVIETESALIDSHGLVVYRATRWYLHEYVVECGKQEVEAE